MRAFPFICQALALVLLTSPALRAGEEQEKSESLGEVEEIIITAKPLHKEGVSIQQLPRLTIERQGAVTVSGILQNQPAIHASTGRRGERIFTLRGFDQRQIVTLVDGVPTYIPYDGQVDLGMLPAELVDHVTIVKGPGSILFGPSGLGGAVNVVTRRADDCPFLQASLEGGGPRGMDLRATHAQKLDRLGLLINAGYHQRDFASLSSSHSPTSNQPAGVRINSDRQMFHLLTRLDWEINGDHELGATLSYLDGERGVPPSTRKRVPEYWRFNDWQNFRISLRHRGRIGQLVVDEVAYYQTFDNLLDGYDDSSYTSQDSLKAFHDWYHDRIAGGRVSGVYRTDFAWGGVLARLWTNLQVDRHDKVADHVDTGEDYTRTVLTAAPEIEVELLDLTFNASLQAIQEFATGLPAGSGTGLELDPLLSVACEPHPDWSLRATVARRSRIPTLRERFTRAFGYLEPNPDLGPEHAWHFGLEGAYSPNQVLSLQAGVYDAEVQGLIDMVPIGSGMQQYTNHESARLAGLELELSVKPANWLRLDASYVYTLAVRPDQEPPDDRLQYRPAHKGLLAISWMPNRDWDATLVCRLVGPQKFLNPDNAAWGELGTYLVADARIAWQVTRMLRLWVRGTNLLDSNHQTTYGYPEPGREVWVGASMTYHQDTGGYSR